MDIKQIGKNIRKIRELRDYDQQYMASELGISQSRYSKLELGQKEITLSQLETIAKVLGVTRRTIEDFSVDQFFAQNAQSSDIPVTPIHEEATCMRLMHAEGICHVQPVPIMNYYR